jgi:hypothetical protein
VAKRIAAQGEEMTNPEKVIWSYLTGVSLPEHDGKDLKKPSPGEIVAFVRDLDAEEMRRYVNHPKYGQTFQKNVNAARIAYGAPND